jgi:hypothetical protein
MSQEVYNQVKNYVVPNYKLDPKDEDNLIIKDKESHLQTQKNPTSSPLILGKTILEV